MKQDRGATGVLWISLGLLIPGVVLHSLIRETPGTAGPSEYELKFGYAWSLLFYGVPVILICTWLVLSKCSLDLWRGLGTAMVFLIPIGVGMNLLFAGFFFSYPNQSAAIGINVPVIGGLTPIEDYFFYAIAFPFVTLVYVWADRYWLAAYHRPVAKGVSKNQRLVKSWKWLVIVAVLIVAATLIKRFALGYASGFPGYFSYVAIVACLPPALLFPNVKNQINWRAFGVTHILMILVCLEWEANMAIPFGFWGFQSEMMTGIFLPIWHDLPIEQVFVWFVSTFVNVVIYEFVRLKLPQHGQSETLPSEPEPKGERKRK